jgi:hypothetical protein
MKSELVWQLDLLVDSFDLMPEIWVVVPKVSVSLLSLHFQNVKGHVNSGTLRGGDSWVGSGVGVKFPQWAFRFGGEVRTYSACSRPHSFFPKFTVRSSFVHLWLECVFYTVVYMYSVVKVILSTSLP